MLQQRQEHGKAEHIHHGPDGDGFADFFVDQQCKGNVDEKVQGTDADAENVLHHSTDAVEAGGGEFIGENEQVVADRAEKGQTYDDSIG